MKWIEVRPGTYKLVDDSDERQAVNLPSKEGFPNIVNKPPWATYEKSMQAGNSKDQEKATDAFFKERGEWTRDSQKLRQWEQDRRKEWAKNKPLWRKKKMQDDPLLNF